MFSLAALLLNRSFAVKDRDADYREWYRRTLFEKRFEAAREEHAWLMRLYRRHHDAGAEADSGIGDLSRQAREWYDMNGTLLEDALPDSSSFIGAANSVGGEHFLDKYIAARERLSERFDRLFENERKSKKQQKR